MPKSACPVIVVSREIPQNSYLQSCTFTHQFSHCKFGAFALAGPACNSHIGAVLKQSRRILLRAKHCKPIWIIAAYQKADKLAAAFARRKRDFANLRERRLIGCGGYYRFCESKSGKIKRRSLRKQFPLCGMRVINGGRNLAPPFFAGTLLHL